MRPSQRSTKPLAVLHRSTGQRRSTWVTACDALKSGGLRRRVMRSQASAFVKTMQSTHQRRLNRIDSLSSRGLRGDPDAFLPSKNNRGACIAPGRARRTSVQAEVEKSISHGAPSASAVRLFFSLTSCHSPTRDHVEIRGPGSAKSRLDGRMVTRERCLSSIEPEASSETGSFRRRAPVAA